MSLDLNKLENKLDEALSNETSESLNRFLNDKRMSNEKKQTAVVWLAKSYVDLLTKLNNEEISLEEFEIQYIELLEQAKEMEKEEIINAINTVSENNVKYANMIVSSWSKIEGELFMHNTKLAEQYFNETYGGNK
jgi:hypothetical protein